jgi:hypothetical protein
MELIDNINKKLSQDLKKELQSGSRLSYHTVKKTIKKEDDDTPYIILSETFE